MMKIVILEENAINNNDISLEGFKKLGEFISYGVTPSDKIIEYIGDADAVLCNKCLITREVMTSCPNLKYIGECATGYNNIDTEPNYYSVSSSDSLANLSCQSSYKSAKFRPSYVQCPVG